MQTLLYKTSQNMKTSIFSSLVLSLLASTALASDVLDLSKSNFAKNVGPEALMLVEFFAPWCGHCKALAPQYEEAATILKTSGVKLAKVDCTAETELCSTHGVSGYPTLKVFRFGEAAEYGGSRKTDGIVSYMKKQALPAVSELTPENHVEFQKADKVVIIAYVESSDSKNKDIFNSFAEQHRDDYLFGISSDSSVISAADVAPPAVVLYKTFDEGRNNLVGSFTPEGLSSFVKDHATPLLDEISPENFASYAEANLPLAYIFVEATDPNREAVVSAIEPVAREHKGKINFVWIDAAKFSDHAKSLNLPEPKWPSFAIQNIQEMLKFPLPQSENVDAATIGSFVTKFLAGEVKPSVKSEPIPSSQDEPVYVLVADSFEDVTKDNKKDMLVEFYAPWCGHCKKLAPVWDNLGEKFAGSKDKVMIGKFDAHNNDVPSSSGIKVQGFPTIKFKKAGSDEWIDYEGDRSLESFVEFVESNSTNDVHADETASSDTEQVILGDTAEAASHARDEL